MAFADQGNADRLDEWAAALASSGGLDAAIARLEAAATAADAPPSLHFGLSALYGRKGLIAKQYASLEKTETAIAKSPRIAFSIALVHGRKETLKSREDFETLVPGSVRAVSSPAGAAVYVDGLSAGLAPVVVDGLKSGMHQIAFELPEYSRAELSVAVRAGLVAVADARLVALEKAAAPSRLKVDGYPLGATLTINGSRVEGKVVQGALYAVYETTAGGPLRVSIAAPDHEPFERELNIESGSEFTLVPRMERTPAALVRRTIKVDGKRDDWAGIAPLFTDASKDKRGSVIAVRGYDIIAAYVCRDDTYLYWRMDFDDFSPSFASGDKYDLTLGGFSANGYDLEVGVEKAGTRSQIWSQNTKTQTPNGSYAAGPSSLEARFRLSQLTGFDRTKPVSGWVRVWRWTEGMPDTAIDETFRRGLIIGN